MRSAIDSLDAPVKTMSFEIPETYYETEPVTYFQRERTRWKDIEFKFDKQGKLTHIAREDMYDGKFIPLNSKPHKTFINL